MSRLFTSSKYAAAFAACVFGGVVFALVLYSRSIPQEFKETVAKWYMGLIASVWTGGIVATGIEDAAQKWGQQVPPAPAVQVNTGDAATNQQAGQQTAAATVDKPLFAPAPPPGSWHLPK